MRFQIVAIAATALILGVGGAAEGKPSFATFSANNCSQGGCHTNILVGTMAVAGEDAIEDLGIQLDGATRGPLKTFEVAPGGSVRLSIDVLDGIDKYAVQLKRLETGGQWVDVQNSLAGWAEDNAASNVWTRYEVTNPPYFTKDAGGDDGISFVDPVLYDFDLQIDPGTPADFYDLVFALAGKGQGLWSQEEHFYVHVVPEPSLPLMAGVALATIAALRRFTRPDQRQDRISERPSSSSPKTPHARA